MDLLFRRSDTGINVLKKFIQHNKGYIHIFEARCKTGEANWRESLTKKTDGIDFEEWYDNYSDLVVEAGETREQLEYHSIVLKLMGELLDAVKDESDVRKGRVLDL